MIKNISIRTVLLISTIILVNLIAIEFYFRFDLTEDKKYTLSKATTDLFDSLNETLTIKAYFSEDLPPEYVEVRQEFQTMLEEYAKRSEGKIVYEFINPNTDKIKEQEAIEAGVQPRMITIWKKTQNRQQKAFMGAVIAFGDKREVIPFVRPGSAVEYTLSSAIKKHVLKTRPVVGFLQGHGEPMLNELLEVRKRLEIRYQIQEIRLTDSTEIPTHIRTMVLVRPAAEFNNLQIQKLQRFYDSGGNLFVALNRVDGNLQNASGTVVSTGLERWLKELGIEAEDNFVVDAQCAAITLQQQTGAGIFNRQASFPYIPVISAFADHPITLGLQNVVLQFASNLKFVGDSSKRFTPIAFSSPKSALQKAPLMFDVQRQWMAADFPLKNIPVAAVLENNSTMSETPKLVLVADGDFVINGPPQKMINIQPDNLNLMVNAIDWLADENRWHELQIKNPRVRLIRQPDEASSKLIKFASFLIPIILLLMFGIYRLQRNINRKNNLKRRKPDYQQSAN